MSMMMPSELNDLSEALDKLQGDDRVECYSREDKAIMLLQEFINEILEEGNE